MGEEIDRCGNTAISRVCLRLNAQILMTNLDSRVLYPHPRENRRKKCICINNKIKNPWKRYTCPCGFSASKGISRYPRRDCSVSYGESFSPQSSGAYQWQATSRSPRPPWLELRLLSFLFYTSIVRISRKRKASHKELKVEQMEWPIMIDRFKVDEAREESRETEGVVVPFGGALSQPGGWFYLGIKVIKSSVY